MLEHLTSLCRRDDLPHSKKLAPHPFIDGLIKRENGNVCLAFGGVGEKNTLRRFCCLGGPEQSPRGTGIPHPKGRTVETERKIMWKENTR